MPAETSTSFQWNKRDPNQADTDESLRQSYEHLRAELVQLQAEDVVDDRAISRVMASLDSTQLRMKAAHGLKGNNPRGHKPIPHSDGDE